jgi:hypothetical protein
LPVFFVGFSKNYRHFSAAGRKDRVEWITRKENLKKNVHYQRNTSAQGAETAY